MAAELMDMTELLRGEAVGSWFSVLGLWNFTHWGFFGLIWRGLEGKIAGVMGAVFWERR